MSGEETRPNEEMEMGGEGEEAFIGEGEAENVEEVQGEGVVNPEDLIEDEDTEDAGMGEEAIREDSALAFTQHEDSVYCVRSHPLHTNVVLSGGGDDCGYMWDTANGRVIHKLEGHTDTVNCVGFSHDGTYASTGGMDGIIKIWHSETGELVSTLEGPSDSVEWLDWHPKGDFITAGDAGGMVWLFSLKQLHGTFAGHAGTVTCGGFSADGKLVVSGSEDMSVRVWSPKTGQCVHTFQGIHTDTIVCLAMSKTQNVGVAGSADTSCSILNFETCKVVGTLKGHSAPIESIALNSSLPLAATGSLDGQIHIWDLNTQVIRSSFNHSEAVVRLVPVPNSPLLVSCSADRSVCVWDFRSGNQVAQLLGHTDVVLDVDVSSDGRQLVTGSDDGSARVFRMAA